MPASEVEGKVKNGRKINWTYAYLATKMMLIGIFFKNKIKAAFSAFDKQVEANTDIDGLGRKKRPPRIYNMNYKDT